MGLKSNLSLFLIQSFLVASVLIGTTTTTTTTAFGGHKDSVARFEIMDGKDPKVVEIGQFAIDEHNKVDNATLQFQSVVKALLADSNYILVIQAEDGKTSKKYGAIVGDQGTQKTLDAFEEA